MAMESIFKQDGSIMDNEKLVEKRKTRAVVSGSTFGKKAKVANRAEQGGAAEISESTGGEQSVLVNEAQQGKATLDGVTTQARSSFLNQALGRNTAAEAKELEIGEEAVVRNRAQIQPPFIVSGAQAVPEEEKDPSRYLFSASMQNVVVGDHSTITNQCVVNILPKQHVDHLANAIAKLRAPYEIRYKYPEVRQILDCYVEIDALTSCGDGAEPEDLHQSILKFLSSKNPLLLLEGNSGSGKSTYLRWLEYKLWEDYESKKPNSILPIFIQLKYLELDKNKQANNVGHFIKNFLTSSPFSLNEHELAKLMGAKVLFLFDGFDEMPGNPCNLYEVNRLSEWNAQVIITSRHQYLLDKPGYQHYFTAGTASVLFRYILPLSQDKIQSYIRKKYQAQKENIKWIEEQYVDQFSRLPNFYALAETPLLLSMICEILSTLSPDSGGDIHFFSRAHIYKAFIDKWFMEEAKRVLKVRTVKELDAKKKSFYTFSRKLAFQMLIAGSDGNPLTEVFYPQPGESSDFDNDVSSDSDDEKIEEEQEAPFPSSMSGWEDFFSVEDKELAESRNACLLRYANQHYSFYHRSFLEYFIADYIFCKAIRRGGVTSQKTIKLINALENKSVDEIGKKFNSINQKSIVNEPEIISFIVDKMRGARLSTPINEEFKKRLVAIVKVSAREGFSCLSIAAANAITILGYTRGPMNHEDFSGVHIAGANLSGLFAYRVKFQNANLKKVKLNQATLIECNFSDADLTGVDFGEIPPINTNASVTCVCLHPRDNRLLAYATGYCYSQLDRDVILYDFESFQIKKRFKGHVSKINCITFSEDGVLLVSGGGAYGSAEVRVWDVGSGVCIKVFPEEGRVHITSIALSSVEKKLLAVGIGEKNEVKVYDLTTAATIYSTRVEGKPIVGLSSDGKTLAFTDEQQAKLYDMEEKQDIYTAEGGFSSLALSKDGQTLAIGREDGEIVIFKKSNPSTYTLPKLHQSSIMTLSLSNNGKLLISGSTDFKAMVWDVDESRCLQTYSGHRNSVFSIGLSSDGSLAATGGADHTIRIWNVDKGFDQKCPVLSRKPMRGITPTIISDIALSEDGKFLFLAAPQEGEIEMWDVNKAAYCKSLSHPGVIKVVVSNDCKSLFSLDNGASVFSKNDNGTVKLWKSPNYEEEVIIVEDQKKNLYLKNLRDVIAFSLRGKFFAAYIHDEDKAISLFRAGDNSESPILKLSGHEKEVQCMSFSESEALLASGEGAYESASQIKLWDTDNGRCIKTFNDYSSVTNVVFFAHDRYIVSACDEGRVSFWEVDEKKEEPVYTLNYDKIITSIALSKHGQLAIADFTGGLSMWKIDVGSTIQLTCCWLRGYSPKLQIQSSIFNGSIGDIPAIRMHLGNVSSIYQQVGQQQGTKNIQKSLAAPSSQKNSVASSAAALNACPSTFLHSDGKARPEKNGPTKKSKVRTLERTAEQPKSVNAIAMTRHESLPKPVTSANKQMELDQSVELPEDQNDGGWVLV